MAFLISGNADIYVVIGLIAAVTVILVGKYFFSHKKRGQDG
jgi:hypothetical protein